MNSRPFRIAFGHQARVGKDVACFHLSRSAGCQVVRFAGPVYAITEAILNWYDTPPDAGITRINFMRYLGSHIFSIITWQLNGQQIWDLATWIDEKLTPILTAAYPLPKPGTKVPWLLQLIGAGLRLVISPDIWVNIAMIKIDSMPQDSSIVIPDLRFINEAQALKARGFTLVKITRKDRPIDRDPNDPSEIDLADYEGFDHVLTNDLTINDFTKKIDSLVDTPVEIIT